MMREVVEDMVDDMEKYVVEDRDVVGSVVSIV